MKELSGCSPTSGCLGRLPNEGRDLMGSGIKDRTSVSPARRWFPQIMLEGCAAHMELHGCDLDRDSLVSRSAEKAAD